MKQKLVDLVKTLAANPVVERAVKTFIQAFIATLIISGVSQAGLIAAGAAGLSAAWNYFRSL